MWQAKAQENRLKQLGTFVKKVSRWKMQKGDLFSGCLRASFAKSYELCVEACKNPRNRIAFFLVPSLRSICEDLIVLAYISRIPMRQREELTVLLMRQELAVRVKSQGQFFQTARPDQPVLTGSTDIRAIQDGIREIWKQHGWPGLEQAWMPSVRQIAEKYHVELLTTLYDYLYRLTSGMVHFNPQVLLRSGWGDPPFFHFSTKNFNAYYLSFARTYSLLLFSLYFELFGQFLQPGSKVEALIEQIRKDLLLEPRWPEMVTFEEMNLELPKGHEIFRGAMRVMDAEKRKGKFLNLT